MHMLDDDEQDDKIVAVANNDMAVNYINDISELPPHTVVELRRFFEDYKKLEHKQVIVEQFLGREHAYKIITDAVELYAKERDKLINKFIKGLSNRYILHIRQAERHLQILRLKIQFC
jgi:Inorganic pyrophosphatase